MLNQVHDAVGLCRCRKKTKKNKKRTPQLRCLLFCNHGEDRVKYLTSRIQHHPSISQGWLWRRQTQDKKNECFFLLLISSALLWWIQIGAGMPSRIRRGSLCGSLLRFGSSIHEENRISTHTHTCSLTSYSIPVISLLGTSGDASLD